MGVSMSKSFQLQKNTWGVLAFLYILVTLAIVLLLSQTSSAQTALTYYSQNGYSKQLANFPDDIKFIDIYSRYITVVTEDNTIRSGFSFQTDSGDIGGITITGIPNVKSAKVINNGTGVALTDEGKVWTWGIDNNPQELNNLPPIKSIDRGISGTTYALDFSGNVWGWGENTRASLGSLGSCSNGQPWCNSGNYVTEPSIIPGLTGIDRISAGESGVVATTLGGEHLLVGTVCRVESNWPVYVSPHTYTQVSNIQSINLNSCSLNSLSVSGEVYSWGVAGMEGSLMPSAKLMNPSFGPVKKIYSDNDRNRLALTENNDIYFYDYFGDVFNPPTEMFIRHLDNDSISLLPYDYAEEGQEQTWGYITTADPEPVVNRARTIGQGRVQPNSENGDIMPGLIDTQQTDKLQFNIDVRRNNAGQIRPTSSFSFSYETGQRCNNPNQAINCHSTQLQSTAITSIDVSGTNRSLSVIRGVANVTVDGITTQKYFEIRYIDNDKLDNGLEDTMQIQIFNDEARTDTIYIVYTTEFTNGNVRIR